MTYDLGGFHAVLRAGFWLLAIGFLLIVLRRLEEVMKIGTLSEFVVSRKTNIKFVSKCANRVRDRLVSSFTLVQNETEGITSSLPHLSAIAPNKAKTKPQIRSFFLPEGFQIDFHRWRCSRLDDELIKPRNAFLFSSLFLSSSSSAEAPNGAKEDSSLPPPTLNHISVSISS